MSKSNRGKRIIFLKNLLIFALFTHVQFYGATEFQWIFLSWIDSILDSCSAAHHPCVNFLSFRKESSSQNFSKTWHISVIFHKRTKKFVCSNPTKPHHVNMFTPLQVLYGVLYFYVTFLFTSPHKEPHFLTWTFPYPLVSAGTCWLTDVIRVERCTPSFYL